MSTAPSATGDDDLAAAQTPGVARSAGAALLFGGLFAALVGAQALTSLNFRTSLVFLPVALAAGGAVAMVLGFLVTKARAGAAMVGAVLAAVLFLGDIGWVVASFANGVVSAMALLGVVFLLVATVLVPVAIGPCRRATAARERLRAADLDIGA